MKQKTYCNTKDHTYSCVANVVTLVIYFWKAGKCTKLNDTKWCSNCHKSFWKILSKKHTKQSNLSWFSTRKGGRVLFCSNVYHSFIFLRLSINHIFSRIRWPWSIANSFHYISHDIQCKYLNHIMPKNKKFVILYAIHFFQILNFLFKG